MKLIKQTNKGEIKIFQHDFFGRVAVCKMVIGFELCKKYAKKNNAIIPNVAMMNSINFRYPTKEEIESIMYKPFKKY